MGTERRTRRREAVTEEIIQPSLEPALFPDESDLDLAYEDVSIEEDFAVTEGEEDLETAINALKLRADDANGAKLRVPSAKSRDNRIPEGLDTFICNYLFKTGMERTLDCFQTEWFEMIHKGQMKPHQAEPVQDVYTHNQLLETELEIVQRERDSYKQAAFEAKETMVRLQKERDFYRRKQTRLVQDNSRLVEDIKSLNTLHLKSLQQQQEK